MMEISESQFEGMVLDAWNTIPGKFKEQMENMEICVEDHPTPYQLRKMKLKDGQLLGLFDGVPKTAWGQAQIGIQPCKITIFRQAILGVSHSPEHLAKNIKQVLMHEIAHYFGYSEEDMKILDRKFRHHK